VTRAVILDGDSLARTIRARLAARVSVLRSAGVAPHFVTILVGNNPASESYVARKHADCGEMDISSSAIRLEETVSADELERHIASANAHASVHGFLVQLPLPAHLDDNHFLARISPNKDIDGLHPENLGRLVQGTPFLLPCTPAGILAMLQHYEVPLAGRKVTIVGRGPLVGRPLAMLLSMKGLDAVVTLAHSKTPDLPTLTADADIVISAVGVPNLVRADAIKPGAAVIGVGISYNANGEMVSDIADDVANVAGWVTPRHGSVGALTRAMLFSNLLKLAEGAH
jgi:methylenetetrahydrofolate dehydrogenase (NADP+)/methenyltetrahydrofolate cyclohydrolase